ncbi:MAG: YwaF family protein [Clostridia bacterium]|nr:YwaF family protein [Clostridia bacterium]
MDTFKFLLKNFFTHKDFLPSADELAGTLFTPLHLVFSAFCLALAVILSLYFSKKTQKTLKTVYTVIWITTVVLEAAKILWETFCGANVGFEWGGVLPLYPCSIFMYALPFAIWGGERVRFAACGYVCSLGALGGMINFVYPANVISNYSCISFAGFHTLFYHGVILFCAATMLLSGYHSYKGIKKWYQLLLPAVPFLILSLGANAVNFSPIGSDYMFFKLNSFFFAPIGAALPDVLTVIMVYAIYLFIHALPYLPSYVSNKLCANRK